VDRWIPPRLVWLDEEGRVLVGAATGTDHFQTGFIMSNLVTR
jgi:hypothetical protein